MTFLKLFHIVDQALIILFIFSLGMLIGGYVQADTDIEYFQNIMNDSASTNHLISDGVNIYTIEVYKVPLKYNISEVYEINFNHT